MTVEFHLAVSLEEAIIKEWINHLEGMMRVEGEWNDSQKNPQKNRFNGMKKKRTKYIMWQRDDRRGRWIIKRKGPK